MLAMGAIVLDVGNWYTHARKLQTKVDAGALAGGGMWQFPCGPTIDASIEQTARQYVGPHVKADGTLWAGNATAYNAQVGNPAPASKIHVVLNGSGYWTPTSSPSDWSQPTGSVCASEQLDVKATEHQISQLWRLVPFSTDRERSARVEIQQAQGLNGVLPIAVRAPVPVSAAAVFYDESTGNILAVKYLVKNNSIAGLPGSLQGWTSYNPSDPNTWANFHPAADTGVVIATSYRGACNTNLPPQPNPPNIQTSPAPCFEDQGFTTVGQLCDQGSSTQIVNCYADNPSTSWPSNTPLSGLQYIQGYQNGNVGAGAPELRSVYLDGPSANCGTYFTSKPNTNCTAVMHATIDVGSLVGGGPPPAETRGANNTEVRYRIVYGDDTGVTNTYCAFNTANCDMNGSGGPNNTSWTTTNNLPTFAAQSHMDSIVIRVRLRNTTVGGTACGNNYSANCEWFFTANGRSTTAPTDAQALANPVQRVFMGDTIYSSSIQWLRLTQDANCDGVPDYIDAQAASATTGSAHCFVVDTGLKGGIATDVTDNPILFNDGVGPSQMGSLDCDPNIPQGSILTIGILQGCGPWYAKNKFATSPLCPQQNNIFTLPNPGPPWTDWPPLTCIKTRPTGSMNQLQKGLNLRFFGNQNANQCPSDAAGFVKGRDYWNTANNPLNAANPNPALVYGYKNTAAGTDTNFNPNDPRIVTIFLTTTEAFAGSGQNTFPIVGFIEIYITGYGRLSGSGTSVNPDDPCPGSTPPNDLNLSGGSASGYVMYGHIINYVVPGPNATPSGILCNPGGDPQPCVETLVR
jgi:hypothetical protein